MTPEMLIAVPGPWVNREDFMMKVVAQTKGEYLFAGGILAHPKGKDHVALIFAERNPAIGNAFSIAGQGKFSDQELSLIDSHQSVVYVPFPLDIITQRHRILKFSSLLRNLGGYAVNVESAGVAHTWTKWEQLLGSSNSFDQYVACVILIADKSHYYSCGMHHFGLPDCQLSRTFSLEEGADLMNQFNFYQVSEGPELVSGHTFSLTRDSPSFRLTKIEDPRHADDDLFLNPNGIWDLVRL
jgi:hypothetical protein